MGKPQRHRGVLERHARLGLLGVSVVLSACGSDESTEPPPDPPGETGEIAINVAANDPDIHSPFDATPSPDGKTVYYTAFTHDEAGERVPGIFKVPAEGGTPETLVSGGSIGAPVGISMSLDGSALYVADPGAAGGGAILTVSASGGAITTLARTEGYYPAGVVVVEIDGNAHVYFTGTDPSTSERGLFSTSLGGGSVAVVATGAPFTEPGGVVVASNGDAYVADTLASGGLSAVIRVSGREASLFVENIGVGFPAGITMTKDESTVLVSGLDPISRTDLVYFASVATGEVTTMTDPIGAFHESAGLHRAHDVDVFAWADSRANDTGTVYVLEPQPQPQPQPQ